MPTVIRWPNKIKSGTISNRTITLADFFATYSEMLGTTVKESSAVDSISFYEDLMGSKTRVNESRSATVMHDGYGKFALRKNSMKLCFSKDTGRNNKANSLQRWQLYDLSKDPQESNNIFEKNPLLANEMYALMLKYIETGRSTDGPVQQNDVHIHLLKDEMNPRDTSKMKFNTIRRKSSVEPSHHVRVGSPRFQGQSQQHLLQRSSS